MGKILMKAQVARQVRIPPEGGTQNPQKFSF